MPEIKVDPTDAESVADAVLDLMRLWHVRFEVGVLAVGILNSSCISVLAKMVSEQTATVGNIQLGPPNLGEYDD